MRTTGHVPALAPPAPTPLSRTVARGAAWTYGTSVGVLVAQIAYTGTTSRLLAPAAFGAYATAQALTSLVGYFTLGSLGSAVTRAPVLDAAHRWSALALASMGGVVGAVGLWLLAPVWAAMWSAPSSIPVVRALILTTAATPVSVVLVGMLRRQLRLRVAAVVEATGAVAGMGAGLVLIGHWHNAQALAAGLGVGTVTTATLALVAGLHLGAPATSRAALVSLFSFASQVSVQNFVYFGVNTAPTWWVSRSAGVAPLGQYSRANLIVGLPLTQLAAGSTKALYPAYAHLQHDLARTRGAVTDALVAVSGIALIVFAGLAGSAPVLVPLLLGPHWTVATALVPAFALTAAANIVFVVLANAFEARAMLRVAWRVQVVLVSSVAVLLTATALAHAPLALVAMSLAVGYGVAHGYQLLQAARAGLVDLRRLLPAYTNQAAISALVGGSLWLTSSFTSNEGAVTSMASTSFVGAMAGFGLWLGRRRVPAFRCLQAHALLASRPALPRRRMRDSR